MARVSKSVPQDVCAIDFGTSNSAVAVPTAGGVALAPVEGDQAVLPTAIFYDAPDEDSPNRSTDLAERTLFGRAALNAYVAGHDGRLMRSMKSILGSSLALEDTDIGHGQRRAFADVLGDFLRHLKTSAETHFGRTFRRALIGRPVYFVDDDPARDAQAQATLEAVARRVGFDEVQFQLEPLAAAHDLHAAHAESVEQMALIADFGGGTCDFSVVRLRPGQPLQTADVLAHHGVHRAGTDFDRHIALAASMPLLGHAGPTTHGRPMPSAVFHDLATWHLINSCYAPQRVASQRSERAAFANPLQHQRLMQVLDERLGHRLAATAEAAKIQAAEEGACALPLPGLDADALLQLDAKRLQAALAHDLAHIASAGLEALARAQVRPQDVALLYFTGGSSRLNPLARAVAATVPQARTLQGDAFASVAKGLGIAAKSAFS